MDKNKGMVIILSSIIFGGCFVFGSFKISDAIDSSGLNISSSINNSGDVINENYELVVNGGWLYLYDKTNGQIWKKLDDDDGTANWEVVKHINQN
ncbi:hypothetical protein ACIQXF_01790 [Lysinibacillus sp. NPDC097231]|uniref:hypothetical protein n=1 Tax=Lysinibacillus sp. NPDC097231 TaxID=3364142 RepID=UPI003829E313